MSRFILVDKDDAAKYQDEGYWLDRYDEWDYPTFLVDTYTNKIVGSDRCEPEDATFDRHYGFLVELLNTVAAGG
jgi:hypothetical protein